MIYVTSFNRAMYNEKGKEFLTSLVEHMSPGDKVWAYHEDSFQSRLAHIHIWDTYGGKVKYFDIFEEMPELADVVERPEFDGIRESKTLSKEIIFLNWHSQFFARKVASIMIASISKESICWLDTDNIVNSKVASREKFSLSPYLSKLLAEAHICFKSREGSKQHWDSAETSFLLLRTSDAKVRDFCRFWWDLYRTGAVFHLKIWADANVFDFCRSLSRYQNLKYINLFRKRPGWKCFTHRLGHRGMARLRASTKPRGRNDGLFRLLGR